MTIEQQDPDYLIEEERNAAPQQAEPSLPAETIQYLQWLFSYHQLMIRQKIFTFAEKYFIEDEHGNLRFFVIRPPHIFRSLLATFLTGAVFITGLIFCYQLFTSGQLILAIAIFVALSWINFFLGMALSPYRDITVYTDESAEFPVLYITQDNKIGIYRWYTIYDILGTPVARARRHSIKAFWRKEWLTMTMEGHPIVYTREDSLMLSLLRRYLGPLYGLLMTNFDFFLPNNERIGEYNRKFSLRDQYLLNLTNDPYYLVDRRVVLAMSILLDTAESR